RGFEWHYLMHLCHREKVSWSAGQNFSSSDRTAFSPGGKLIAAASGNTVGLWEVASGKSLGSLSFGDSGLSQATSTRFSVRLVVFSQDGEKLVTVLGHSKGIRDAASGSTRMVADQPTRV